MKNIYRELLKIAAELESIGEDHSSRVKSAIRNLHGVDKSYLKSTLGQRLPSDDNAAGSVYPQFSSKKDLYKALLGAKWEPYDHPAIGGPAKGFKANLPGTVGIVDIDEVPEDVALYLDDRKNTGQVSLVGLGLQRGKDVEHSTIILGPEGDKEIMWTVHPGDPVRPLMVNLDSSKPNYNEDAAMDFVKKLNKVRGMNISSPGQIHRKIVTEGLQLTKSQAKALGFENVKVEG